MWVKPGKAQTPQKAAAAKCLLEKKLDQDFCFWLPWRSLQRISDPTAAEQLESLTPTWQSKAEQTQKDSNLLEGIRNCPSDQVGGDTVLEKGNHL